MTLHDALSLISVAAWSLLALSLIDLTREAYLYFTRSDKQGKRVMSG